LDDKERGADSNDDDDDDAASHAEDDVVHDTSRSTSTTRARNSRSTTSVDSLRYVLSRTSAMVTNKKDPDAIVLLGSSLDEKNGTGMIDEDTELDTLTISPSSPDATFG
jgi:hypothetical protein